MPERIGPWRRFRQLPRAEQRSVLSLAWRLPLVDVSLRVFGVRRTRRRLLRGVGPPRMEPVSEAAMASAQRLAALAASVGGIGRASCLRQALVVEQCLRRRGLPAELRLGVRKNESGGLGAHAWVELGGVAIAQTSLRHDAIAGVAERL